MKPGIHPLQSAGYDLMKQLYSELSLPMTNAMITAQRQYYPSIESILKTLDHYSAQQLVAEFRKNNETLISNTIQEMNAEKDTQDEDSNNDDFSGIFGETFDWVKISEVIKGLPIKEIEKALGNSLSELSDENINVSISQIQNCEYYSGEIDISLKVTAGGEKS